MVASLPLPAWLPFSAGGRPLQLNFKWMLRKVAAALAAFTLLYCAARHRDYEGDSFRRAVWIELTPASRRRAGGDGLTGSCE